MYLFRKDLKDKKAVVINVPHTKTMMCLNESTLDPWKAIGDKVSERLKSVPLNRYFNPITQELKQSLAKYIGHGISPNQILFGNGADEMLYYIFTSVRENEHSFAACLAPSYFDYKSYCDAVGLNVKFQVLDEHFDFSADAYIAQTREMGCKLAVLCNPNNPTGNLFPDDKLIHIIKNTEKLVLLDETYFEFSGKTFADKLSQFPNLIILRSFSKAFSGAGLRFGYIMTSEENAIELNKVMTAFHSSLMIQAFAQTMLENKEIFLTHTKKVCELREEMYSSMLAIDGLTTYPSKTNFQIFTIGEKTPVLFDYLTAQEIAVRPVWGHPLLKNHLRVTIGTKEENKRFLDVVSEFIQKEQ
ncbi:MAG TPA: histidinol-phosphate transaminase [Candidatus Cloacimonadota bacterium]|nr:histidinol-phosphate transaminase [Candidatus Cloacimonadota bacterium]HPT71378.1 histidinol-phosphate transaminase [Candidatus Cloacimonadota bacterium]